MNPTYQLCQLKRLTPGSDYTTFVSHGGHCVKLFRFRSSIHSCVWVILHIWPISEAIRFNLSSSITCVREVRQCLNSPKCVHSSLYIWTAGDHVTQHGAPQPDRCFQCSWLHARLDVCLRWTMMWKTGERFSERLLHQLVCFLLNRRCRLSLTQHSLTHSLNHSLTPSLTPSLSL